MKIIRPVSLLSLLIFLGSIPHVIFAKNEDNILNLKRSRELLYEGNKTVDFYDDHKSAIEIFTEAIRLNQNNFYAFLNRAYSKNEIKNIAGAWDDLNRALELEPNNGIALYNRAVINLKLGHTFSSIRDYSKAINKKIELKNAYAIRGLIKSNIGDAKGACSDWQKASEYKNEIASSWVQENCIPTISKEFKKNTENKVLMVNARRKYFAGEIREACNYYEKAKMNGYEATNLRWKLKLKFISDPMCFLF